MKSTHVYAIINRMFSEKRTVGESYVVVVVVRQRRGERIRIQDIICSGVKRTHLVNGIAICGGAKREKFTF